MYFDQISPLRRALVPAAAALALLASGSAMADAASKKELINKIVQTQMEDVDALGRAVVERPVMRLMQDAGQVLQTQVPEAKREATAKAIEAELKKFVSEEGPKAAERARALAPSVLGATLDEKFSEDELKTILAWLQSPASKKYLQAAPEMGNALGMKVASDIAPSVDPKFAEMAQRVRTQLGIKADAKAGSAPAAPKKK